MSVSEHWVTLAEKIVDTYSNVEGLEITVQITHDEFMTCTEDDEPVISFEFDCYLFSEYGIYVVASSVDPVSMMLKLEFSDPEDDEENNENDTDEIPL